MATKSEGIQRLLQAEQRANAKVAEAKKKKQKRLKEAKEEAKKEILLFKNNQEVAFQDKMAKSQGYGDDYTAKINKEGQVEAAKLDEMLASNQGKVVDWLLDHVSDIKPEVHRNYSTTGFA
ncbi:V-type proton ATPase subunit G 1-like [Bolinopsis microptera]|uniref:V-type proton ATPase subunit G 1-like n=1 Tax=Bolinopsis microptera TaxID=2820187 RepID=UPI00307A379D